MSCFCPCVAVDEGLWNFLASLFHCCHEGLRQPLCELGLEEAVHAGIAATSFKYPVKVQLEGRRHVEVHQHSTRLGKVAETSSGDAAGHGQDKRVAAIKAFDRFTARVLRRGRVDGRTIHGLAKLCQDLHDARDLLRLGDDDHLLILVWSVELHQHLEPGQLRSVVGYHLQVVVLQRAENCEPGARVFLNLVVEDDLTVSLVPVKRSFLFHLAYGIGAAGEEFLVFRPERLDLQGELPDLHASEEFGGLVCLLLT
mmetsp:Transcript_49192/g.106995  ORF Transcript_49192/g.106995 Transcript_49192/m.106995 type:complete len:255 (+) Transcript_49192:57-821(+)